MPTEIAVVETTEVEPPAETSEGFGVIYPAEKPEEEKAEDQVQDDTEEKCIQAEQLAMNRVSERGTSINKLNFIILQTALGHLYFYFQIVKSYLYSRTTKLEYLLVVYTSKI